MVASSELAILITARDQSAKAFDGISKSLSGVGKAASAPVKALGSLGGAIGNIASLAGGFALGGAIAAAPGALLEMAKGAAADEQATARLSQTLRNLPGDFDQMSGAVNDAIAAGQRLAFTDDDIRDSFQFLATATGSSEEALSRQKIALDLARGANIPLAQATKLVGKVNEENVETFKKLGITIGDNATEAEALAAVQAKFAGQSEAYANSTAGQFEQAQIALAEIGESIGAALLPALAAVGKVLADNMPAIQEFIGGLSSALGGLVGDTLAPLLAMLPDIGKALGQVFAFMRDGTGDIETFRGVLNALIGPDGAQGVIEIFTNMVGFFKSTVIPLWQSLAAAAQKALGGDLNGALQDAAAALGQYAVTLIQNLAEWARRFIEWVAPMIPPLLIELGKLLLALTNWILTVALPAIVVQLGKWALAFIEWVATDVLPKLPGALKDIDTAVKGFLTQAAIDFATEAGKVGKALLDGFMTEAGKLATAAWNAIAGDDASSLKSQLYSALKSAIDHAISGVKQWIDGLIAPFRNAWNAIKDLLDKIRGGRSETEGAGGGGGGGATASALRGGGLGVGSVTIYNTIDARGQNQQVLASAWGYTLADAMRTRLISGAI